MTEDKPSSRTLRIILIDDSPDDAEQASQALRQVGYVLKTQRLESGVALDQALDGGPCDLILCAHGLANVQPAQVVDLLIHKGLSVPVIALARQIHDSEYLPLIDAGVRDVILKGQWARLAPAVRRELATAEERRRWAETRESLLQMEGRYRAMIEASHEPISYVQDGMHMDANPAYLQLFGHESLEQLKEIPLLNLFDKADQTRLKAALRKPEGADRQQEYQAIGTDGKRFAVQIGITSLTINGEPCVQIVIDDISRHKALEEKLQTMRHHDALTGLFNRARFLESLAEAIKSTGGVLLGISIDNLPALNQLLGHVGGDTLLVKVSKLLRELSGEAALARLGGGQFAILLDDKASADVEKLAVRIRTQLGGLHGHPGQPGTEVSPSVRQLRVDKKKSATATLDELFKEIVPPVVRASTAAPVAKPAATVTASPPPAAVAITAKPAEPEAGPALSIASSATPFTVTATAPETATKPADPVAKPAAAAAAPEPPAATLTPVPEEISVAPATPDLRELLQQAVTKNRLELLFQPIVNLHGDPKPYYEAQYMLRSADDRLIPAREYMATAEAAGLGGRIDRNLMINVIDLLSKHHAAGKRCAVFVKLSSTSLQDTALLAAVEMHLKATGISPRYVILQIDESALVQHATATRAFIAKAKAARLHTALDNFTGGGLSVESLAGVEVDFIAVNCGPDGLPEEQRFGAIDEARALDRTVIARGVEDNKVFSSLFSRGVHYVQGDFLQPASTGLDYNFESDQTIDSNVDAGPGWTVK